MIFMIIVLQIERKWFSKQLKNIRKPQSSVVIMQWQIMENAMNLVMEI